MIDKDSELIGNAAVLQEEAHTIIKEAKSQTCQIK
jgi:hypothetical protein